MVRGGASWACVLLLVSSCGRIGLPKFAEEADAGSDGSTSAPSEPNDGPSGEADATSDGTLGAPDAGMDALPIRDARADEADADPCKDGGCPPPPVLLQPAHASCKGQRLAVDGSWLYWTDRGRGLVLRASVTGGTPTVLAAGEKEPIELAVRRGQVFWVAGTVDPNGVVGRTSSPRWIVRAPSEGDGGAATTLVDVPEGTGGLAVSSDGETVYFGTGTRARQIASRGGPAVTVATGLMNNLLLAVAVDGNRLAYTNLNGNIWVAQLVQGTAALCGQEGPDAGVLLLGCARIESSNGQLLPDSLLFENGQVHWADGATIKGYDLGAGSYHSWSEANDSAPVSALARSRDSVFFARDATILEKPFEGTIERVSASDLTGPHVLARHQHAPASLAVAPDGQRVYWSDADCAIWSAAP